MKHSKALIVQLSWTLLSLVSALPILGMTLGNAAWNGVNFWVGLYLVVSCLGILGLILGFYGAFSNKPVVLMTTALGSWCIAILSVVYAGFFSLQGALMFR